MESTSTIWQLRRACQRQSFNNNNKKYIMYKIHQAKRETCSVFCGYALFKPQLCKDTHWYDWDWRCSAHRQSLRTLLVHLAQMLSQPARMSCWPEEKLKIESDTYRSYNCSGRVNSQSDWTAVDHWTSRSGNCSIFSRNGSPR